LVAIELHAVERHLPIVETRLWDNEAATQAFARQLARLGALSQAVISLQGDLGAGKTTLARYLLGFLGVQGRIKSPTYTIVELYEVTAMNIWHFDFYRFNDPQEWEDAGFRDVFASPGLKLVEWAEKAAAYLPPADLTLQFQTVPPSEGARLVTLTARTALGAALLDALSGAASLTDAPSP
jgi:tRNA threonylcarbamoyladenosine biosynthesis protein TsaE